MNRDMMTVVLEAQRRKAALQPSPEKYLDEFQEIVSKVQSVESLDPSVLKVKSVVFQSVRNRSDLDHCISVLSGCDTMLALDIVTSTADSATGEVVAFSLCKDSRSGYLLPLFSEGYDGEKDLPRKELLERLRDLFSQKRFCVFRGGYVLHFLRPLGLSINVSFDVFLARSLLSYNKDEDFAGVVSSLLDCGVYGSEVDGVCADAHTAILQCASCVQRCQRIHSLYEVLEPRINQQIKFLYYDVELPLVKPMAQMNFVGVPVDVPYLQSVLQQVDVEMSALEGRIYELSAKEFNIQSPQQLAAVLYDDLGLVCPEFTPSGGRSVADSALQRLESPVVEHVLRYRALAKLRSNQLSKICSARDGRVYPVTSQIGAVTGRMTGCGYLHPHTVPNDKKDLPSIRKGIGGLPGYTIVCSDFSGQEPRITASYTKDPNLLQAFADGHPIHAYVAKMLFSLDCAPSEVASKYPEKRKTAKVINLALVYGKGPRSMADDLSRECGKVVAESEAKNLIDSYFKHFPGVKLWLDEVVSRARRDGFVCDLIGRRRDFPELKKRVVRPDKALIRQRFAAEREAKNFMVQGMAVTQTKRALHRCCSRLSEYSPGSQLIAVRHDELMFLVPDSDVSMVCEVVKHEMENDPELIERGLVVKPEVEITYGRTWSDSDQVLWVPPVTTPGAAGTDLPDSADEAIIITPVPRKRRAPRKTPPKRGGVAGGK